VTGIINFRPGPAFLWFMKSRIMKQNLSFGNVLVRYLIGIHLVIIAGLLQSMPLVILSIGLIFTCISGWDPIVALTNAGFRRETEKDGAAKHGDGEEMRTAA
jgi:hypothetical protein